MGELGDLLAFERVEEEGNHRSEARIDAGGDDPTTCDHCSPPGEDSHPILGVDEPIAVEVPGSGKMVVVGYIDPKNAGVAASGEVRRYARDSEGNIVGVLFLTGGGPIRAGTDDANIPTSLAPKSNDRFARLEQKVDDLIIKYNAHTHPYNPGPGQATPSGATTSQETALGEGDDVSSERFFLDK